MDLSTRANNSDGSGGGDSGGGGGGDSGNGRRRNGAAGGRPAKSVFSIRSLVGEDTSTATASSAVQQHRREPDENRGNDRTPQRPRHRRDRRRDDAQRCDDGESWVTFFSLVTRARTRARGSIILIIISIDISFGFVQNVQRLLLIAIAVALFYTGRYLCRIDFHRFDRVRTGLRHDPPPPRVRTAYTSGGGVLQKKHFVSRDGCCAYVNTQYFDGSLEIINDKKKKKKIKAYFNLFIYRVQNAIIVKQ